MAIAPIGGSTGSISFVSGLNAAFNHWTLSFSHGADDATGYDTALGSSSAHYGSGLLDYSLDAGGFLCKSSVAGNQTSGFGQVSVATASAPVSIIAGGAVTLTAKSGCTFGATFVTTSGNISHSRRAGSVPVTYSAVGSGVLTETWAVS